MSVTITKANFESEVLQSPVPVLLDFWASWCGPCKMIAPILDQIAAEQDGKVKIGKINVDEENELAMKHEVVSIPTLALYKEGKLVQRQVGAIPKVQIEAMLGQA